MSDKPEDISLLICQCMKVLLTRQEKAEAFSRALFEALWRRLPLEQDDVQKLRTFLKEFDGGQAPEELQKLGQKLDAAILALKDPQKNS
jgi:hypothetical protein